jgi:diguanylate cyclase (GGDEF)-like protein
MRATPSRNPAGLTLIAAVCFGLAKASFAIGGLDQTLAAIWLPAGFAMAALVLFGVQMWPGVYAGALMGYSMTTGTLASGLIFATGDTLGAVVGAILVERLARGRTAFEHAETIFRFAAIAGLTATVNASLAAIAPAPLGIFDWPAFSYLWTNWWFATVTGSLAVAPFAILWLTTLGSKILWREFGESLLVLSLLTTGCLLLFGPWFAAGLRHYPVHFMGVPFLLWIAFRLGRRGMATGLVVLSTVPIWGTVHGWGPFVQETPNEALMLLQAYVIVMAITGLVLAAVVTRHRQAEEQLLALATTDSLTGLANHRRLIDVLRAEIARSHRTSRSFVVVFVDMDGLKAINDKLGHLAGSRAIARVADALRASCRAMDTPARYGGDEFAIVLPETNESGGRVVLDRVASRLAADTHGPTLSVSGGVAVFPRDGESPTLLLRAADRLLYEAKGQRKAGRLASQDAPEKTARTG